MDGGAYKDRNANKVKVGIAMLAQKLVISNLAILSTVSKIILRAKFRIFPPFKELGEPKMNICSLFTRAVAVT